MLILENFFQQFPPAGQALIGGLFTWSVTACGAALIFLFPVANKKIMDAMLGMAAGVMLAASFWSLLSPAIKMCEHLGRLAWMPALIGFLLGGAFLRLIDKFLPHLHLNFNNGQVEGIKTSWHRSVLMALAITLHNIPEGLAVGVAFGAAAVQGTETALASAIAVAIGIGLQDFPEGFAVASPLRREGLSPFKSFWFGQLSGAVEVIGAVIGALIVVNVQSVLPYALAFAAGAMIFVVVEEVIPEAQSNGNTDLATLGLLCGFALMMVLDVGLS
jgi:ZIP family zinc transporter